MTPRRRSSRNETRRRCEIATAFVNVRGARPGDKLARFIDKHWDSLQLRFNGDRAVATRFLQSLGTVLRDAWDPRKRETAEQNIENIFAADSEIRELTDLKPGEARMGPVTTISALKRKQLFERPAFKCLLGQKLSRNKQPMPTFEPRDVLDEIAYAILRAGSLGLLKTCEGERKEWGCKTPYLVADEGRRRFCYEFCGDYAKAEAKKNLTKARKTR
jgi:hypothetical protein